MNVAETMTSIELITDAELVATSLTGNREAFGRIVERYQRLLCSLAYSATGSLSGCVNVSAPDKPIEINLNVNIRQEVIYTLKKDAESLITENPELFPK